MANETDDLAQVSLIIAAAETEDELGTVLRLHLAFERLLNVYLFQKRTDENKPYVQVPQEFGRKLGLAVAFGLPVAIAASIHQINRIRNDLAHGKTEGLTKVDVAELVRKIDRLDALDPNYNPVAKTYIELTQKSPAERVTLGQKGERFDFLIAAIWLYGFAVRWMVTIFPHLAQELRATSNASEG